MRNKLSREQIRYWFDRIMSRGPIAMTVMLLAITAIAVGIIGILAFIVAGEGSITYQLWLSLLHTLDPGTLAGNSTDNILYLLLMFIATLFGLFFTSILIGVIATGVESKLNDLRKGTSVVQEYDHTVIIGFNNNTFDLLRELIEANSNKDDACIVILGEQPKDEIEETIASRIPDSGATRIVCRSGSIHEDYALERCAVEASRSVIINTSEDAETVKMLLALLSYLRNKTLVNSEFHIVASIQDKQYVEAANIAGEGLAQIIYSKDAISRIIASTCQQHGLSQVFSELFNFIGNEFYFEHIPQMEGKTFKEALLSFSNAIAVGIYSEGQVLLNPPMDRIVGKDDLMILLEEDDGSYNICSSDGIVDSLICSCCSNHEQAQKYLVVLGSNDKLPLVLSEYNKYVEPNTKVLLVDDDFDLKLLPHYENLNINVCCEPVTQKLLYDFLDNGANNILLLNDDSLDPESSDSKTLLYLILLRDIADKTQRKIAITTEMRSAENQKLASRARVDDFVISSNFTSLLMAQISEDPRIVPLIAEVLDESGSEFHMKPVADYVRIGEPVNSYTLTESAARIGEVYIGYRLIGNATQDVVVNPNKEDRIIFWSE